MGSVAEWFIAVVFKTVLGTSAKTTDPRGFESHRFRTNSDHESATPAPCRKTGELTPEIGEPGCAYIPSW